MEVTREEMDEAVKWLREQVAWMDRNPVGRQLKCPERALAAYIDLLEKRVRELGGEP